jgi:hypothetical protein
VVMAKNGLKSPGLYRILQENPTAWSANRTSVLTVSEMHPCHFVPGFVERERSGNFQVSSNRHAPRLQ